MTWSKQIVKDFMETTYAAIVWAELFPKQSI